MYDYKLPYNFILSLLFPLRPVIKKMLGGYALIDNDKVLFLLSENEDHPEFSGVFVGTAPEFYKQLQEEIHKSNMTFDIDGEPDSWIFLSEDLPDFKDKLKKVAELIKQGDNRIGKKMMYLKL